MTYTAEPAWGHTVDFSDDIAFDGLATHETTNSDNNNQSGRNGGKRRGAE